MNISRERVLAILTQAKLEVFGILSEAFINQIIRRVEELPEAPGMDSALRRAQEANWNRDRPDKALHGRSCEVYRGSLGPNVQCGEPAAVPLLFPADQHGPRRIIWACAKCAEAQQHWTQEGKCLTE